MGEIIKPYNTTNIHIQIPGSYLFGVYINELMVHFQRFDALAMFIAISLIT